MASYGVLWRVRVYHGVLWRASNFRCTKPIKPNPHSLFFKQFFNIFLPEGSTHTSLSQVLNIKLPKQTLSFTLSCPHSVVRLGLGLGLED